MPWQGSAGSQTFVRTDGTRTGDETWTEAAGASVAIREDHHDIHDTDIGDAVNECLKKDGGNNVTANIPFGGFKATNVAEASARTDWTRFSQLQDNKGQYIATVGGTADVITLTPAPVITAYAAGQRFAFIASGDNTTNVTVNVSAVGAKAVVRPDGDNTALSAADIQSGTLVDIMYDGTRFLMMNWRSEFNLNPTFTNVTATKVQSTTIEVGHASDTTLTRVSAGLVAVEGSNLLRASDVVDDLTTGGAAVPLSGAQGVALKALVDAIAVPAAASAAEQEAGTEAATYVAPATAHRHPSACKAWVRFNASGTVGASYNITSITDSGVGNWTVNIATDFSSANYSGVVTGGQAGAAPSCIVYNCGSIAAGTFAILAQATGDNGVGAVTTSPADPTNADAVFVQFFGDQA